MYKYLILILICISFCSCEGKKDKTTAGKNKTDTVAKVSPIVQKKFKGMFEYKENRGLMTDCETGSLYLVENGGEARLIDSVYKSFDIKNPKRKLYVIGEGFNSVKENPRSNVFDTVIVITRLTGTDTSFNCQK